MSGRASQTPGKFEVKFGSAPSSEAMTETVIEPKVVAIDNGKYDTYSGIVKATSSGAGHIGVHALTEAVAIGGFWLQTSAFQPRMKVLCLRLRLN